MGLPLIPLVVFGTWTSLFVPYYYVMKEEQSKIKRRQLKPVDFDYIYKLLLDGLNYSLSEKFDDKKVYAYYIYSLILTNQVFLKNLIKLFKNDDNLLMYKNSMAEWEDIYNSILDELLKLYRRYLSYESIFKGIFGIPYEIRNYTLIKNKIPAFQDLKSEQLDELLKFIINPLFRGYFPVDLENVDVIECFTVPISKEVVCKNLNVEYELPYLQENSNKGIPDIVHPWYIYNNIVTTKKSAKDAFSGFFGVLDVAISEITGVKKSWTLDTSKKVLQVEGSIVDWTSDLKKDMNELENKFKRQWDTLSSSGQQGLEDIEKMLLTGGGVIGLYMLYNTLLGV